VFWLIGLSGNWVFQDPIERVSFIGEKSEIDSPEWHRNILDERKRKIENGKAKFISLEELRASRKS